MPGWNVTLSLDKTDCLILLDLYRLTRRNRLIWWVDLLALLFLKGKHRKRIFAYFVRLHLHTYTRKQHFLPLLMGGNNLLNCCLQMLTISSNKISQKIAKCERRKVKYFPCSKHNVCCNSRQQPNLLAI